MEIFGVRYTYLRGLIGISSLEGAIYLPHVCGSCILLNHAGQPIVPRGAFPQILEEAS